MNYLSTQEVKATLELAMEQSARDHLLLLLSFRHGMRRGEIAQLTLDDVQNNEIRVKRLKGSLETVQPLMADAHEVFDEIAALERWLKFRPEGGNYLFPSPNDTAMSGRWIGKIAKKYLLEAGVPKRLAHHHSFKHAVASLMIRQGVTVEYVRQWVGHRDVKNTINFYTHISDEEAADKAISALGSALEALAVAIAGSSDDAGELAGV
jgi:type 1 fimbriae regulatory protein FimB